MLCVNVDLFIFEWNFSRIFFIYVSTDMEPAIHRINNPLCFDSDIIDNES